MFRRRHSQSRWQKLQAFIWPRKGFSRVFNYLLQRILRMPGSAYSLAAGVACGASVSFTPFIGFHLFLALMLAYVIRANMLATLIGTAVGNPWTFPLIFVLIERIGTSVLGYLGVEQLSGLTAGAGPVTGDVFSLIMRMAVGGALLSVIIWPLFFGLTYWLVKSWRRHRQLRREQAWVRRERVMSAQDTRQEH